METDSFFYQLLKQLPETLFELLDLPPEQAAAYKFDALEIKKSYRLDGLFVPKKPRLPLYFVEVQFHHNPFFYPNLFSKVFWYLGANNPNQDWVAVAMFANRSLEPKAQPGCQVIIESKHLRRIYLDELTDAEAKTAGLMLLRFPTIPEAETRQQASNLLQSASQETDCDRGRVIVQLTEEVLLRYFPELNREEIRRMFRLHDLRKSKVWQEAHGEGQKEGQLLARQQLVQQWHAEGKSLNEIAKLLKITLAEARRFSREQKPKT